MTNKEEKKALKACILQLLQSRRVHSGMASGVPAHIEEFNIIPGVDEREIKEIVDEMDDDDSFPLEYKYQNRVWLTDLEAASEKIESLRKEAYHD